MKIKSKGRVIDLSEWLTPKQLAINEGLNYNTVRQYLHQNKHDGKSYPIEWVDIPELGITLVKYRQPKIDLEKKEG